MQTLINLTLKQFKTALQKCSGKKVAIDCETDGLFWYKNKLTTVGFFCPEAGICGAIDIRDNWSEKLQKEIRNNVKSVLAPETTVIMHNCKFDLHFLDASPLQTGWKLVDTTVLIHLLDSRYRKGMEKAEQQLLGSNSKREHIDDTQFENLPLPVPLHEADRKKKRYKNSKVWDWHKDKRQIYCINDTVVTYQFFEVLYPLVEKKKMKDLFIKDMKYLKILYEIEKSGILIDPVHIKKITVVMIEHKEELEKRLYDSCGNTFNWRSPQQLSKALYDDLGISKPVNPFLSADGLDHTKFVDRGLYNKTCTSSFLLMEKAHHPLGELVCSLREAAKLIKTLDKWLELADKNDFIHTNFNLTGTRTGRLSSSKPNMQNVPGPFRNRFFAGVYSGGTNRTGEYNLRNAFVARSGYKFLAVDYRQMEMRMFALLSEDKLLLKAIKSEVDIHTWIATQVWGECDAKTAALHRKWSKAITFGLVYGMTTGGLQFRLEMSRAQAQKVSEDYWNRFPRIRPWMQEVINECKTAGYVQYWSSRIWKEEQDNKFYKAANALIQGGCADILSIAVIRVYNWLQRHGKDWGRIVNIIHDEIITEIPETAVNKAAIEISQIMEVPDLFDMPFLVSCKVGTSYGDLEKFEPIKEAE